MSGDREMSERERLARDLCEARYGKEVTADAFDGHKQLDIWCGKEADHLLAAGWHHTRAQPVAAWRPISEAETGGDPGPLLIAVVGGQIRLIRWCKTSHVPLYGFCVVDQGPEDIDLCLPTHFMPLPEPPQ